MGERGCGRGETEPGAFPHSCRLLPLSQSPDWGGRRGASPPPSSTALVCLPPAWERAGRKMVPVSWAVLPQEGGCRGKTAAWVPHSSLPQGGRWRGVWGSPPGWHRGAPSRGGEASDVKRSSSGNCSEARAQGRAWRGPWDARVIGQQRDGGGCVPGSGGRRLRPSPLP